MLTEQEELEMLELEKERAMAIAKPVNTIKDEQSKTFIGGLKAGITAQPGSGVGHFIGAAIPATVGGALGGPIGAAAGEAARQTMGAIVNPEETAKKSPIGIGLEVAGAGYGQKAGEVAGPYIGKAISKTGEAIAGVSTWLSGKIGKSLLKASKSLNAYGHEPEKALMDEKIVATTWDNLIDKVKVAKHDLGEMIEDVIRSSEKDTLTNVDDVLTPIDDALKEAGKFPTENETLIKRLTGLKEDTYNLLHKSDKAGMGLNTDRANSIKKSLYRVAKYKGLESDDIPLNKVKQLIARKIANKIEDVTPELKPLNSRYGNVIALENAAENRAIVASRGNMLGIPEFAALGLLTSGNIPAAAGAEIGGRVLTTPIGATSAMKGLAGVSKTITPISELVSTLTTKALNLTGGGFSVSTIQKGLETELKNNVSENVAPKIVADNLKSDAKFYDKD